MRTVQAHLQCAAVLAAILSFFSAASALPESLSSLALGGPTEIQLELPPLDPAIPSPQSVLGYRLGERFTHAEDVRRYLGALAAASPRVSVSDYGTTYEGRPLTLVAITSARNQARMEEIRRQRQRLTDPGGLAPEARERLAREAPAVVWLGYGIHGNESSSTEAALAVAYVLAAGGGDWGEILEQTVVLIDPLSNPDGRERYVAGFEQRSGRFPDPDGAAAEHWEPWPGGRQNHYLVDLNRDWVWATQLETRYRLAAFRAWEPQVYVDLHEMASEATYFFPPSAEPVNPGIDPRTVRWLGVFGDANAAAFDRPGWLYYKSESFDLFYPGYGDSYPSFRGAVGMTYEVGGGGRAGLEVALADGSVVTLADRIARHLVASLTTVRTAAAHREALLADFVAGRVASRERTATTYLWADGQPEAAAMAALLALHGVEVRRLAADQSLPLRDLGGGEPAARHPGRRRLRRLHRPAAGRPGAHPARARDPDAGELPRRAAAAGRRPPPHRVLRRHRLVAAAGLQRQDLGDGWQPRPAGARGGGRPRRPPATPTASCRRGVAAGSWDGATSACSSHRRGSPASAPRRRWPPPTCASGSPSTASLSPAASASRPAPCSSPGRSIPTVSTTPSRRRSPTPASTPVGWTPPPPPRGSPSAPTASSSSRRRGSDCSPAPASASPPSASSGTCSTASSNCRSPASTPPASTASTSPPSTS